MQSFLIEQFPEAIEVNGEILSVNSDFCVGLQIMSDFENPEFDQSEKAYLMLNRLYKDLPEDRDADFYEEALKKATKFLNAGDDSTRDVEGKPRLYSFGKDARLIYSAFSQTHGVDLQTAEIHWWRFMALFLDLGANTSFSSMVSLRKRYYENKLSDEEKTLVAEMGDDFLGGLGEQEEVLDEDEIAFVNMLPEEDKQRFLESRKR